MQVRDTDAARLPLLHPFGIPVLLNVRVIFFHPSLAARGGSTPYHYLRI